MSQLRSTPSAAVATGARASVARRAAGAPLAAAGPSVRQVQLVWLVALLPIVAIGAWWFGPRALAVVGVSAVSMAAVQFGVAALRRRSACEAWLVHAVLFGLMLGPMLPLWMVALGAAFGAAVGSALFGGHGRNLFHPAVAGRVFLSLSYPSAMGSSFAAPAVADAVTSATPLAQLSSGGEAAGLAELCLGLIGGSIGETCVPLIVLSGLAVVIWGMGNWRGALSMLAAFGAAAAVLHAWDAGRFPSAPWQLCAGGVAFGACLLATDTVTLSTTRAGRWIVGAAVGLLAMAIRATGAYADGVAFALLLGSVLGPLVDWCVMTLSGRARHG